MLSGLVCRIEQRVNALDADRLQLHKLKDTRYIAVLCHLTDRELGDPPQIALVIRLLRECSRQPCAEGLLVFGFPDGTEKL